MMNAVSGSSLRSTSRRPVAFAGTSNVMSVVYDSPGASTRLWLNTEAPRKSSRYSPAPPTSVHSVIRANGSRLATRAIRYRTMSVAPPSTAPIKRSTVNGFKPSVIIVLLPGFGRTRRFQGVGLMADECPGARATPVPGAPIGLLLVPAGHQTVHDDATVLRTER